MSHTGEPQRWPAHAVTRLWRALGPGLVTGAADDDPSGIATYSQAGAQFGYALTWTMFLTVPFMAAVQTISAYIGWTTSNGLTRTVARHMPRAVVYALVALLAIANTINIAADLAAMGEAMQLVVNGSSLVYACAFGALCLAAEVAIPYHRYAGLLKALTLVLFVYVAAAFSVHVPWGEVASSAILPDFKLDQATLLMIVAIFGTTISPYLFFWQASQEAEESRLSHRGRHAGKTPTVAPALRHISFDTWIGTLFSHVVAFFIIVTTAATLHASGITKIETAAQAAEALRPIAGELTFALFAAGIIGTGLLAIPVLAGSAAYALSEAFGIRGSLELPFDKALGFYAIVGSATLAGAALTLTRIDPIAMLFWTAVINGVVAVPIMLVMMGLTLRAPNLSGLPRWLKTLGWAATALMTLTVAALAWQSLR